MWLRRGLIYRAPFDGSWRDNSALTPTPFRLNEDVIRIFVSFRNPSGIGRIGYVDVSADNPADVIQVSDEPCLDVGQPGMFDDSGVILGDVVKVGQTLLLYYVGFQLVANVKFLAYTGLASSENDGSSFTRVSSVPVMDRSDEGRYIRAIHNVIFEDNIFKCWYAVGNGWKAINGKTFPQYHINYTESVDGVNFGVGSGVILPDEGNCEYRIGRPRVFRAGAGLTMHFTFGTTDGRYQAGQATSLDGRRWERNDKGLVVTGDVGEWEMKHFSYPAVIPGKGGKVFMFYNGNDMGRAGFGFAELS
jgi:hypothetical protein